MPIPGLSSLSMPAFTLRVSIPDEPTIVIHAYDDMRPQWDEAGRIRLTCTVRQAERTIFPKGQLTCALHGASDGTAAKELILSLVAMRPGDTDAEHFDDYTPGQLAWATEHGEMLDVERAACYCDPETGAVRK